MKKPPLGSGKRFAALARKTSPAIAAWAGRRKYGNKKMSQLSAMGKRRVGAANMQSHKAGGAAGSHVGKHL